MTTWNGRDWLLKATKWGLGGDPNIDHSELYSLLGLEMRRPEGITSHSSLSSTTGHLNFYANQFASDEGGYLFQEL